MFLLPTNAVGCFDAWRNEVDLSQPGGQAGSRNMRPQSPATDEKEAERRLRHFSKDFCRLHFGCCVEAEGGP